MSETKSHQLSEKKKLDIVRDAYRYCSVNQAAIVHNVSIKKVKQLIAIYDKHGPDAFRFKKPRVDANIAIDCIIRYKLYGESASSLQSIFNLPSQAYIYNWLKSYSSIVECIDNFKTQEDINMSKHSSNTTTRLSLKYQGSKEQVRAQIRNDYPEIDKRLRLIEYLQETQQDYASASAKFNLSQSSVRRLWKEFSEKRYRGIFPLRTIADYEVLARYEQPTVELTWYDYEKLLKIAAYELELRKKFQQQK